MCDLTEYRDDSYSSTYCPEDNKLRLYTGRVPRPVYDRLVELGFKSTPKQSCDFVATWSVKAEDACYDLISEDDDIGDEDYSPEERAADRAERFSGYRDKRRGETHELADRYEAGPSAFGHQNLSKAERAAEKHERLKARGLRQWSKAEYWQQRTEGVIAHALHRCSPEVRRGRILTLEAEQRKYLKSIEEAQARWDRWNEIAAMTDPDEQTQAALAHAGSSSGSSWDYPHPDKPEVKSSIYSLMEPYDHWKVRALTGAEAAALYLKYHDRPNQPGSNSFRWLEHYERRLQYENMMLENEGGKAAEVEMEVGGFIGKHQIHGINRSPVTKRVVSVKIMAPKRWWEDNGDGKLSLRSVNIERLGADVYRPPTDEEREAFYAQQKEEKKAKKAAAKGVHKAALINPTDDTAEAMQAILNSYEKDENHSKVLRMTQAQYSDLSKGSYAKCETVSITERLREMRSSWSDAQRSGRVEVFKIRICRVGFKANRVIILTDKPQKPLPFDLAEQFAATMPNEETHGPQLVEFMELRPKYGYEFRNAPTPEEKDRMKQLRRDFGYLGWMNIGCADQCDLTDSGREILKKYREASAVA